MMSDLLSNHPPPALGCYLQKEKKENHADKNKDDFNSGNCDFIM